MKSRTHSDLKKDCPARWAVSKRAKSRLSQRWKEEWQSPTKSRKWLVSIRKVSQKRPSWAPKSFWKWRHCNGRRRSSAPPQNTIVSKISPVIKIVRMTMITIQWLTNLSKTTYSLEDLARQKTKCCQTCWLRQIRQLSMPMSIVWLLQKRNSAKLRLRGAWPILWSQERIIAPWALPSTIVKTQNLLICNNSRQRGIKKQEKIMVC